MIGSWSTNLFVLTLVALVNASAAFGQHNGLRHTDEGFQDTRDLRSLKEAVGDRFKIGVGVGHDVLRNPEDASLIKQHFEILTPENCMKPQGIHPVEDEWSFAAADRFAEFARANELEIVGHCLVWAKDDRTDEWMMLEDGDPVSRETMKGIRNVLCALTLLAMGNLSAVGADVVRQIQDANITGGLVAQIGADDLTLTELGERFHVRLLLPDDTSAQVARTAIDRVGLRGRFTASTWNGHCLPRVRRRVGRGRQTACTHGQR